MSAAKASSAEANQKARPIRGLRCYRKDKIPIDADAPIMHEERLLPPHTETVAACEIGMRKRANELRTRLRLPYTIIGVEIRAIAEQAMHTVLQPFSVGHFCYPCHKKRQIIYSFLIIQSGVFVTLQDKSHKI